MRSILRFNLAVRWLCLLALAAYAQTSSAQVITNLTVNNSTGVGGTGLAYQICPGGGSCGSTSGMVTNALQYVDRTFTITSAVPSNVNGATFIMTANNDKNTSPGSSSYMSFTLTQAATVYIAHTTAVTTKPAWLTANFTDTGTSITNSSAFTFELYSANFAAGSTVTLGSNVVTGGNTSQAMYTVIVVPTASQTLISNLVVNNPTSSGGTGTAYQVCPGGSACGTTTGFVNGALQYLDRTYHINTTVPASLTGQTFIMTANSDKSANSGATNFISFTVGQAATVYVAHCTAITTKPSWLTSNFTNTGQVVSNDNGFSFGLYSRTYASGSTVTLGSNLPAGTTSASMYTVIVVPAATSTLVSNVVVNNGGTNTYAVCGTGGTCGSTTGFVSGAPQYVDSAFTLAGTIPANVNGRTFIQTAEADKSAGAGTSNFLSFTLGQSATVFVAHDVRIPLPTWLKSQFLDTGVSVKNNNGTPGSTFEIYSNLYPSGTDVQLGGNTQSGTTTADMYSVVVAQTTANTTAPNAPGSLALISGCNTAAVVGFTWTASTVNTGGLSVAGYRITRGGTIIATVPFTQTSYQDTSVLQSTAYTYTVTAFDQAGNTSPASTLSTTTAAKSATGDAQFCHSTKITAMTVDFLNAKSETNGNGSTNATNGATPTNFGPFDMPPYTDGSDLWSATQAADGNTYVFFGDGWGLCGREDTGSTMANDQTSFGFGKMTGLPSTGHCPPEWSNVYGGANNFSKPNGGWTGSNLTSNGGLILGKVSNVIAIGNDFYGFGAAWRSGDSSNYLNGGHGPPKSGPNNHLEVLSSTGTGNNGSAWTDNAADLCNGSGTAAAPVWGGGLTVCPAQPIQFGPGYTGVPSSLAGYVYIYAVTPQSYLGDDASDGTYLVRVPTTQVTTPSAYQYFAGLDSSGNPIWSSNGNQKQVVFKDLIDTKYTYTSADGTACAGQRVFMEIGLRDAVYDAPLGRYIANAQGRAGQVAFYEAPNPWGPWSTIAYTNLSMSNIYNSGWGMPPPGGLGGGFCTTSGGVSSYKNSSGLGVHIMNGFTDSTGKNIVMTFSSNGLAPPSASDLGGANANPNGNGNEMDSLNMFHAVLTSN